MKFGRSVVRTWGIPGLCLTALFLSLPFSSPAAALEKDGQTWLQFYWQGPSDKKLRGYLEVQSRFGGDMSRHEMLLLRPAVYYEFLPGHTAWLGVGWTPLLSPSYENETRYWQQYQFKTTCGESTYQLRSRFEQRDISGVDPFSHRFRQQLRGQWPVFRSAASEGADSWKIDAVLWDEIFFNLNGAVPRLAGGYNQNRIFAGVNIPLREKLNLEVGYLNVNVRRPAAREDRMMHTLLVAVFAGF